MKPAPFTYHAPKTVDDAIALLARYAPEEGRVLAGGQSLVPMMNFRLASPAHLIDINGVRGLDRVREEGGHLVIPACVRHAAFETPVVKGPLGTLLATVARHIAHVPVRSRGTFCGSLAHADPASEWCLAAVTLGAVLTLKSVRGERRVAAGDFLAGIMTTTLAPDELLVEARIPLLPADARCGFYEVSRRAGDFAMTMAMAVWQLQAGGIGAPRLGVGGAEPVARCLAEAARHLDGQIPTPELFATVADKAAQSLTEVMQDAQTSAEFRRELTRTVVRRALERSLS
jgi:carbon-monoxide dehydrogenase medium subunit